MTARHTDYFTNLRLDYIAECLQTYGHITWRVLVAKFNISRPQATKDLALFMEENPGVMIYVPENHRFEKLPD